MTDYESSPCITASTPSTLTAGSILFSDGSKIAIDNTNLFFDDTNNRLHIGSNTGGTNVLNVYGTATNGVRIATSSNSSAAQVVMVGKTAGGSTTTGVIEQYFDSTLRMNGVATASATHLVVDANGAVMVGTATNPTGAILSATSTAAGFLPPRMTEAQRDAIGTPTAGLIVYNSTTNLLNFYNGSAWGAI